MIMLHPIMIMLNFRVVHNETPQMQKNSSQSSLRLKNSRCFLMTSFHMKPPTWHSATAPFGALLCEHGETSGHDFCAVSAVLLKDPLA